MKIIIISGTPGTGKTSISNKIAKFINAKVLTLNEIAISEEFTLKYDDKRDTHVIDEDKLVPFLKNSIIEIQKENFDYLIIESHFSDMVPEEHIDFAIVLRCNPDVLYKRLEARGYNRDKIMENIQSEILGNCVDYLLQKQMIIPILELDTTNLTIESSARLIINLISGKEDIDKFSFGKIDWLQELNEANRLNEFFD
ncbi:MAG: hypothetical protein EU539_13400 [Promethearchaeota archaeon]|nr:MAG: hypothetical protein EU539_13400 [Candidatus Lokiarchaeota archaeon]